MDDEREIPRLVGAATLADVEALHGSWIALRDAGVEGLLVAPGNDAPPAVAGPLRRIVAASGGMTLLLDGAPSLAGEVGAGLVLPEGGMAVAEARRQLHPGALLGREASAIASAALASGVDFLVGGWSGLAERGAGVRLAIETASAPILWRVGRLDEAREAVALGAEGVVLDLPADPVALREELRQATGLFPRRVEVARSIVVDGTAVPLPPESAITDVLADLGLTPAAVRRNGVNVPRRSWDDTLLSPGDVLDLSR